MYQNAVFICIPWYKKLLFLFGKNDNFSRNQGVWLVVYALLKSVLGNVQLR